MSRVDIAELRRLHAQGARSSHSFYVFDCIPALLDELEAAREEVRRLKHDLDGFQPVGGDFIKAAKAIGAAEELEKVAKDEWQVASDGGNPILIVGRLQQRAAQLRREAEDGTK